MALARMIILDECSFRFVENEGFTYFMKEVEPRFSVPSHITVSIDCMKPYLDEELLKKVFRGG